MKHSKRIKTKRKARTRSAIAKDLLNSGKYHQRIVKDKRGKYHDMSKMSFRDLVTAIQEMENYGD